MKTSPDCTSGVSLHPPHQGVKAGDRAGAFSRLASLLRFQWPYFWLVAAVLALQQWGNAYTSELNHHADEPAHFITGLLVYDYLHSAIGTPPMEFAETYYLHFPKVAFGHWPPLFYFLQAIWYSLAGPSLPAAMALTALFALGVAGIVFTKLRFAYGSNLATASAVGMLFLPGMLPELSRFMAELPLTLFSLLAVFAFASYAQKQQMRHAVAFSVWSILAILTKGNALALAFLVPFTIVMLREFRLLRDWRLWASGISVGVVCGPIYYMTLHMATSVGSNNGLSKGYLLWNIWKFFPAVKACIGLTMLVPVAVGSISCMMRRYDSADESTRTLLGRVCLAWILSVSALQILSPISGEPRYLVPVAPACAILAAEGIWRFYELGLTVSPRLATLVLVAPSCLMSIAGFHPLRTGVSGYRLAAQYFPVKESTAVLISSDTIGEGSFIVERRLVDVRRDGYVLRASKVMASDSWTGKNYQQTIHSAKECRDYLVKTPVEFILIDVRAFQSAPVAHHLLLKETMRTYADEFPLVKTLDLEDAKGSVLGGLRVFRNLKAAGQQVGTIRVEMKRVLGREIVH